MKPIIPPVDRSVLKQELSYERFVRDTNNGTNKIYIVTHSDSPHVMQEIGRLREATFRAAGGGTGKEVDIDEFDTAEAPYRQLIVWSPEDEEIVGGYRYIKCAEVPFDKNGVPLLATSELFQFSPEFISGYLPYTIELGRSFVQPKYQSGAGRKGLFSLDNLWDGLGALVVDNPEIKYLFGKVTMYLDFHVQARDMILYFLNKYFPDPDKLVYPHNPQPLKTDVSGFAAQLGNCNYKDGHRILHEGVRALGESIPPLINAYANLSSTMKTFGTSLNDHFGEVEETGILVTINDIYPTKKERHISSYIRKA